MRNSSLASNEFSRKRSLTHSAAAAPRGLEPQPPHRIQTLPPELRCRAPEGTARENPTAAAATAEVIPLQQQHSDGTRRFLNREHDDKIDEGFALLKLV